MKTYLQYNPLPPPHILISYLQHLQHFLDSLNIFRLSNTSLEDMVMRNYVSGVTLIYHKERRALGKEGVREKVVRERHLRNQKFTNLQDLEQMFKQLKSLG